MRIHPRKMFGPKLSTCGLLLMPRSIHSATGMVMSPNANGVLFTMPTAFKCLVGLVSYCVMEIVTDGTSFDVPSYRSPTGFTAGS